MFRFVTAMFGCAHHHCTFPITARQPASHSSPAKPSAATTYVVCLDCGREFPYDWELMKVVA
jgi:predicted transcriptional regulator